jgi:hypothetical protein
MARQSYVAVVKTYPNKDRCIILAVFNLHYLRKKSDKKVVVV